MKNWDSLDAFQFTFLPIITPSKVLRDNKYELQFFLQCTIIMSQNSNVDMFHPAVKMYSASVVDNAIVFCLLLVKDI